jgi:hypothetical protein
MGCAAVWYNAAVKKHRKKAEEERPVFDSIRKPTAPPSQRFGGDRPIEKVLPSQRKAKHKKQVEPDKE